jgi:dolichol kinase
MKKISKRDYIRKCFHILTGIIIIILIYFNILTKISFTVFIITSLLFYYINFKKINIPLYSKILKICQKNENDIGLVTFLTGCGISYMFFSKDVAIASIAIFTFGDSFANLFGQIGKTKCKFSKKKNIEGFFAGVIISTLTAGIFIDIKIALFASSITMFIEFINSKIDDNIFIAPIAAIIIKLFS